MDIISEIRNAPEEGAKRLEREYKARLMAVAMNLCGDKSEAEALVYDTMGKAVSQIESLSKPESFFSWMCSILTNTYSKSTRRMSNEKVVYTDSLPDSEETALGEESVLEPIDGAILREAVNELPEKLRESVILRYFMDMPLLKMAKFLAIPVGTVNSRLHLARKALAARLGPTGRKSVVAALVALALLGATAAFWVGGAFDGGERGAETTGTTKTTETSETVPEVLAVPEVPESSESQSQSEVKEAKAMNIKATTAVVAAALVFPSSYGGVQATGGETKIVANYMVHTFTNSGTFTVTQGGKVDVLVVAGGGGGGSSRYGGGGGGAGGVVYQEDLTITSGVFTVTVGAGGTGGIGNNADSSTDATKGENSSIEGFDIAVAKGGGAGGSGNSNYGCSSGGSGGGRGGVYNNEGNGSAGTAGQGYAGGGSKNSASYSFTRGGGGGGAGAAGTKGIGGSSSGYTNGTGGIGIACSISGEEKWYAGGGGGGASNVSNLKVAGGSGVGGGGRSVSGTTPVNGTDGTPNTGGGGGGGGGYPGAKSANGGNGGSGIVIVRYAIAEVSDVFDEITGGVKTRDGEYEIHTFTNSGTFHVSGCSKVDVLVVGGGGGGGAALSGGGGGGAGGVVYKQDIVLISGDYEIVVGAGGTGGVVNDAGTAITTSSAAGSASSALGFIAKGGGCGGNTNEGGGKGASGGGAAAYTSTTVFKSIGGGASTQGNLGGASTNDWSSGLIGVAGGGGGAGARGNDGVIASHALSKYGAGGDGIACSITGEEKWYGGGGGGGYSTYENSFEYGKSSGGKGGGGRGSGRYTVSPPVIHAGTDGEPNTGGGGGGGGGYSPNMANGGKGGSGVVIIRCKRIKKGTIVIVL